jgi:hypothetical protein
MICSMVVCDGSVAMRMRANAMDVHLARGSDDGKFQGKFRRLPSWPPPRRSLCSSLLDATIFIRTERSY